MNKHYRTIVSTSNGTETAPLMHHGLENRHPKVNLGSGLAFYDKCYHKAIIRILKPFFFASVGVSISISRMSSVAVLRRGFVYGILMILES